MVVEEVVAALPEQPNQACVVRGVRSAAHEQGPQAHAECSAALDERAGPRHVRTHQCLSVAPLCKFPRQEDNMLADAAGV